MKNKIIALLLAVVMMCSFAVLFASADGAMLGDLNGDGKITAADAREALRGAAKLTELTEEQKKIADVNFDGKVTALDARMILRAAAKIDTLPENTTEDSSETTTEAPETTTNAPETTTVAPEPDTGVVVDTYPEAIDAFFSGAFYLEGAMGDEANAVGVKMATNKTGTEIVMEGNGTSQLSLFAKKGTSYLKVIAADGKKYYIELTKEMMSQYGVDFDNILGEFSFTVIDNPGKPVLTKGEYKGETCDIYTFKKSDGSAMVFYAKGDEVVKIAATDSNGKETTEIFVDSLTGKIPATMLTIKGFTKTNILMLPSIMPDFA